MGSRRCERLLCKSGARSQWLECFKGAGRVLLSLCTYRRQGGSWALTHDVQHPRVRYLRSQHKV
eukprot:3542454-Amphidinium_carterae.1